MNRPPIPRRLGFFTRLLDQASAADRYRLATEQIIHAERQGFDSAWVAQHHFHEDEGGLPAPFVFLAQAAARTSTIRLGTGIVTLTLEDPVRVAEDAAVFDLIWAAVSNWASARADAVELRRLWPRCRRQGRNIREPSRYRPRRLRRAPARRRGHALSRGAATARPDVAGDLFGRRRDARRQGRGRLDAVAHPAENARGAAGLTR